MRSQPKSNLSRLNSGMTLIEVLIATVVLAIGLLGVAAFQVSALQGASNAQFQSKATDITSALVDRIRANLEGDAIDAYVTAAATCADTTPATICSMDADDVTNTANDCSPTQMAAYDLWHIRCRSENTLPGGQITVVQNVAACPGCCSALTPMEITVSWQTDSTDAALRRQQVITTIIPGSEIYIPGEEHPCVDE
jgi:type IV pilus assembly protein PilV